MVDIGNPLVTETVSCSGQQIFIVVYRGWLSVVIFID